MRTVFITSLGKKPDKMVEEERSKAAKRLPIIKLRSVFPEAFLTFLAGKCLIKFDKSKRRFFDSTWKRREPFQVTVVADGPLARGGIRRNQTICDLG